MPQARTKSEIQSIAHDEAIDATSGEFSELNDNIAALENKIEEQNVTIEELGSENENLAQRLETLEQHDAEVRSRLNM